MINLIPGKLYIAKYLILDEKNEYTYATSDNQIVMYLGPDKTYPSTMSICFWKNKFVLTFNNKMKNI